MPAVKSLGKLLGVLFTVVYIVGSAGCAMSPEAKEAKFLNRGKAYLEVKDYQRAILEFFNATKVRSKDGEAFYQLGLAYSGAGQYTEAYIAFRKAAERDPKHAGAQAKLAELMATSRDEKMATEAKQHAEEAARLAPQDPDALYALAVSKYRLGDRAEAEEQLRNTLERFPSNLRSSVGLASIYLSRNDFKGAEEVLKKTASENPASTDAILALANVYEMASDADRAEGEYRRALHVDPKNGSALTRIARLQLRRGQKNLAEQTFRQISALPDKTYQSAYAFFLVDQERLDEAIVEFRRLAKQDPSDKLARSRLVSAYMAHNQLDEAQNVLAEALKKNANDADALFQQGEIYIKQRRYAEAQQDLTSVLHSNPSRAEAHYLLSEIYKARGAVLLQKQELSEALRYKPDLLEPRIALAYALVSEKDSKGALEVLDRAPDPQKQLPSFQTARNWALVAANDVVEARKGVDAALAQLTTPERLLQDAILKAREKEYPSAQAVLESILKADPANTQALGVLAQTYLDQKQPGSAVQKVREYAMMRPGSYALQAFAADWFLKHGSPSDAATAISAAKAADPRSAAPELLQAQLDWHQGKADRARSRLAAILAANDRNAGAHLLLALIEENSGNDDPAILHYRRVLELEPRQPVALNGLAYELGNHTTQLDEALKLAREAKEVDPANPAVDDTLGWILFRRGDYRSAREYLETASAKSPDPVIKYHLAIVCFKMGETSHGRQALLAALQANPRLPEAVEAQSAMASTLSSSR